MHFFALLRSQETSVTIATGRHLFPSRTQQLSPSAPMVLGWQRSGRVGHRRGLFFYALKPTVARRQARISSWPSASNQFLAHGQPLDEVGLHADAQPPALRHGDGPALLQDEGRIDDVFVPVAIAGRDISR